ncbi:hypothetical protein P280DRAFT_468427 [Massarina eburnea CBS 473.64]|uniref:Autophagy-related protein 27 n=1 Tax=Massarina eburnea CBS 473.64 TaxID=1395130 RepID=A0A6A6S2A3_9PLEO|nr:hypothetical protein P280DRAFT_468427 [Massarina eburnea CBS 473.64]
MSPSRFTTLSVASLLTLAALVPSSWASLDCNEVLTGGVKFNFGELGAPHIVHWTQEDSINHEQKNWNFTVDLCQNLKRPKGANKNEWCNHGTRVCAIREEVDTTGSRNATITPIDIAGNYATSNGRQLEEKFERLRNSKSNADTGKEGVRIELHGGRWPADKADGTNQRAIIEMVCDPERTGLEGDEKDNGEHEEDGEDNESRRLRTKDVSGKCEDSDKSLRFCGYELEEPAKDKKVQTLRLEWRTKHACENVEDGSGSHWGFFTWFIIILFLATAAYLIFGSWLNYNRYGARGWDLLPHGDAIRDIPYILKDFGRKVVTSAQGSGNRGGYSAV